MIVTVNGTPKNILAGMAREKQLLAFEGDAYLARTAEDCTVETGFLFADGDVYEVPERVSRLYVRAAPPAEYTGDVGLEEDLAPFTLIAGVGDDANMGEIPVGTLIAGAEIQRGSAGFVISVDTGQRVVNADGFPYLNPAGGPDLSTGKIRILTLGADY